jgi:hypothetical protein
MSTCLKSIPVSIEFSSSATSTAVGSVAVPAAGSGVFPVPQIDVLQKQLDLATDRVESLTGGDDREFNDALLEAFSAFDAVTRAIDAAMVPREIDHVMALPRLVNTARCHFGINAQSFPDSAFSPVARDYSGAGV